MNAALNTTTLPLRMAVEHLVSEHGLRAVLAAVFLRLLRPAPPAGPVVAVRLSDHIRRDIGLPPQDVEPPATTVPPVALLL